MEWNNVERFIKYEWENLILDESWSLRKLAEVNIRKVTLYVFGGIQLIN